VTATIVLEPIARFDAVAACFTDWEGGPTDRHAWLAGEPIGARWRRDGAEVSYSANPVIGLRVLSGADLGGLADGLPVLSPSRARELSRSDDLQHALLGITASGLYGDLAAVPELTELARDSRRQVRDASELALRRVGLASFELATDRIAQRRRESPERDPLFGLLGPAATRRQLIRWLALRPPEERERRVELVRAALHDDDWEVRWSAVIAAYELGLGELTLEIKRCRPAGAAHRLDRQILEALREVVGWHLAGGKSEHSGATHLRACLTGDAPRRDRAFLLITALRHPLPVSPVPTSPAGFCTVPAVMHWVGDPDLPSKPLRAVVPRCTFSIAETARGPVPYESVPAALRALSRELRLPLRLPSAEELELAVRGPDGRRYPWGNGRERGARQARSPWGLLDPLASAEWVDQDGAPLALGDALAGCAGPLRPATEAAVRAVVADDTD
jgi:hypothetical protein